MAFRDKFRQLFYVKDTPHRIALTFALGVFIGISPFLGIHTIGAFFLAWLLGLNKFIAITGVYVTNPWTIVPIYSFGLWLGAKLIGMRQILPEIDWPSITFINFIEKLKHLILPFFVGTITLGIVSAVASYFVVYTAVNKYRNRNKHAA